MTKPWTLLALCAVVAITTGCATQNQMLTQKQGSAVDTALQRAKFEMNCPSANASVLSQDFIQPAIQGPWVGGLQRAEYTIGVEGCGKRRVTVARVEGKLYAFDDLCTHEGCPLSSGLLTGMVLMCQCHGSQFDVTTGGLLRGPATKALTTYEVCEQNGKIQVRV